MKATVSHLKSPILSYLIPFNNLLKSVKRLFPVFLMVCSLSVLFNACGPEKQYNGQYLPDEELVVLKIDEKQFTFINILTLDGEDFNKRRGSFFLHPGEHTLLMEAAMDYPYLEGHLYFDAELTFEAEAGRVYTLCATILPMANDGYAWISSDLDPEGYVVKKYPPKLVLLSSFP